MKSYRLLLTTVAASLCMLSLFLLHEQVQLIGFSTSSATAVQQHQHPPTLPDDARAPAQKVQENREAPVVMVKRRTDVVVKEENGSAEQQHQHQHPRQEQQVRAVQIPPSETSNLHEINRSRQFENITSLHAILDRSDLVLLYFGASWCSHCRAFATYLNFLHHGWLTPPDRNLTKKQRLTDAIVSLVYISSDMTQQQYDEHLQARPLYNAIPFENQDKTALKRMFHTCAGKERIRLAVDRKYGIPNLLVISGKTHATLTMDGAEHLRTKGAKGSVNYWLELNEQSILNVTTGIHGGQTDLAKTS